MKILHVITSLNRGGAEIHLLNLVSEQVKNGHKVIVAYWKEDADLLKFFRKLNISTICLNKNKFFIENFIVINFFFCSLKLNRIISSFNPEIIHAHLPFSETICFVNLFFYKKAKFIISKHLDTVFFSRNNKRKSFLGKNLERLISKKAEKIICISNAVKKFMSSNYMKIDLNKLETIYYGLDFKLYNDDKKNLKIVKIKKKLKGKKIIGTISRLVPQKRLDDMINAFKIYNLKYEKNSRLIIVGKGPDKSKLKLLSSELGISDKIIWIDYLSDIKGFFSLIDIFCLTSEHEGFGIVTLEAFYNKKPVICSKAGSLPEIVKNKFNGISIPKNKKHLFPLYFDFLMIKKNRNNIIANAQKILKKKFTNKEMYNKTNNIYKLN